MQEDGFEYKLPGDEEATFFRWSVSDGGKDIVLIDRFAALPLHEFFAVVEDSFDRSRGPILLAMIATSIRKERPDWSVERITRTVFDLSLSEIEFIDADEEEAANPPRAEEAPTGANSNGESKSSAIPAERSPSETSRRTPA